MFTGATKPGMLGLRFLLLTGGMGVCTAALKTDPIAMLSLGGSAVDIPGEGIVIGESQALVGSIIDAGQVDVHEPDGAGWTVDVTLSASDVDDYDHFGGRSLRCCSSD